MFKLDNNFLIELGLGDLSPADKNRMLSHIYDTLEMRVGMKLAQGMTNQQLDEFETFIKQGNEASALKWLEFNFPDYKKVVANELELLKSEVRAASPQILASATQQPQVQVSAAPIQSQPQQYGNVSSGPVAGGIGNPVAVNYAPQAVDGVNFAPQPQPQPQPQPPAFSTSVPTQGGMIGGTQYGQPVIPGTINTSYSGGAHPVDAGIPVQQPGQTYHDPNSMNGRNQYPPAQYPPVG